MRSNLVIKLSNDESYYIIAITLYDGNKYYITNHLNNNAKELTDDFVIFKEYVDNNKISVKKIEDIDLIYEILKKSGFID